MVALDSGHAYSNGSQASNLPVDVSHICICVYVFVLKGSRDTEKQGREIEQETKKAGHQKFCGS